MYIDESGSELVSDKSPYYLTSGVIFHEDDLSLMKRRILDYKNENFISDLVGAEIHLYDMFNCIKKFEGLTDQRKWDLINKLYDAIDTLPMTTISACINKEKLVYEHKKPEKKIIEMAYTIILERFQMFLQDTVSKGMIRIDRTTDKNQYKLNDKDRFIIKHINNIRRRSSGWLQAVNVVEESLILDSNTRKGLQVADAIAYCTTKFMNKRKSFDRCWSIIHSKIRRGPSGQIEGYGLIIFPKK